MEGERENQSQRLEGWGQDQSPWQGMASQAAGADHSSPELWEQSPGLGKAEATPWEGELSLHKRLCSGSGVQGRWGLAQSLRTGGDASWRMQGQRGRKWPGQLLDIWNQTHTAPLRMVGLVWSGGARPSVPVSLQGPLRALRLHPLLG